jgi:hypothetical protein
MYEKNDCSCHRCGSDLCGRLPQQPAVEPLRGVLEQLAGDGDMNGKPMQYDVAGTAVM